MIQFSGRLHITGGTIKTWQQLILAAIDERDYDADGPTNLKMRAQMKDRFRAASAYIQRFIATNNIFLIDAFKGNVNGTITQAAWALPGDVTAAGAGTGTQYDAGLEFSLDHRVGLASQAVFAVLDTDIDVDISVQSVI